MTCAGLLGLAAAQGSASEAKLRVGKKPGRDSRPAKAEPTPNPRDPSRDPKIRAGLIALGNYIAQGVQGPGVMGGGPFGGNFGGRPNMPKTDYYYLWSLERVAMILDLKTIGKKDWYAWGSRIILDNQAPDGGWHDGRYDEGGMDTCFALLFLRRSNLATDLTTRLKGKVKDPGETRLVAGGSKGQNDTPAPEEKPKSDEAPIKAPRPRSAKPLEEKAPRASAPKVTKPVPKVSDGEEEDIEKKAAELRDQLVKAEGERQGELIEQLKDNKGAANTLALAEAIPKLKGKTKDKAREALALRLARMTNETLRGKLEAEDVEIRRAAALACAVKEDKKFIPALIRLLDDKEAVVERAAHAALKSLTDKDFGPRANATEEERKAAIKKWRAWWVNQNDD
jgi:hypothetical protein